MVPSTGPTLKTLFTLRLGLFQYHARHEDAGVIFAGRNEAVTTRAVWCLAMGEGRQFLDR